MEDKVSVKEIIEFLKDIKNQDMKVYLRFGEKIDDAFGESFFVGDYRIFDLCELNISKIRVNSDDLFLENNRAIKTAISVKQLLEVLKQHSLLNGELLISEAMEYYTVKSVAIMPDKVLLDCLLTGYFIFDDEY